jgi:integrase
MARKRREPTVEVRTHSCADGSVTEMWSVRYYDASGARRRLRCASREEADFERARLVLAASLGQTAPVPVAPTAPAGGLTLAEFWPVYCGDAEGRLARSTLREYERLWDRRVAPHFGHLSLDEIRPRMVSQWRAQLLADGVGTEATRYAMVLLQAMFTLAIEWGETDTNPVSVVRKPRQGRHRAIEPLTPEDIERLRRVLLDAGDDRSATLVSVLAYAGLRPGEALGLEWRHIRDRTLLIEQAVNDGRLKRQKTNRVYRTVDLLAPLAEDLAEWRTASGIPPAASFVFPRLDGQPWRTDDWNNWRNRHFHPAAAKAGLGRPRPYDLRHAFASLLIREQRTSIVELAEQLGHAPTMTLNTYTHVFREHRRSEPVEVTDWIRRARNPQPVDGSVSAAEPRTAQARCASVAAGRDSCTA